MWLLGQYLVIYSFQELVHFCVFQDVPYIRRDFFRCRGYTKKCKSQLTSSSHLDHFVSSEVGQSTCGPKCSSWGYLIPVVHVEINPLLSHLKHRNKQKINDHVLHFKVWHNNQRLSCAEQWNNQPPVRVLLWCCAECDRGTLLWAWVLWPLCSWAGWFCRIWLTVHRWFL